MAIIVNTIRWADNTKELKANLLEGVGTIDVMRQAVDRTVNSLSGTGLSGAANKATVAIQQMGGEFGIAGGLMKLTSAEQERLNALMQKATEKAGAMGSVIPAAWREIEAGTRKAEVATVSFQAKMSSLQSAGQAAGLGLSAALTVPIVGMGAASLKASMDFETAFAGVRKTVSGTPAEMEKLNAAFREMAKTTPVTAVGLALIGEQAGQLGVQKDKIIGFTKTIVDISTATNLTADEAGSAFARLANVLKMPQEQFSNLGSAVVALGNFGASTEQEMLNMAQRISAAGATANMTAPQVLGIANALSSVGIEAEAGGTAMSRVILKISSDVASGGGQLQLFAKTAGMSAKEFGRAWRDDAGDAFSKFMQGLASARNKGGDDLLQLVNDLGFGAEVRLKNALLSAANAGTLMADSIALGTKAFKENTEIGRASEERYKTTANQLKILRNNLDDVAMTIGDVLTPMLSRLVVAWKPMVALVSDLAKGFKDLPDPMQSSIVGVLGLAAAIGPLLLVGVGVISLMLKWEALLVAFPAVAAASTVAVGALTTGMVGMVAVSAGVVALAAGVGTLSYALTRLIDSASGGKLSGLMTPLIAGAANAKLKTEEAAAGADSMRLAFERTGIKAKDVADALRINTEWLKKHNQEMSVGTTVIAAFDFGLDKAGAATETVAEKVKALTEAQKADILSKREQHTAIKDISKETGIATNVVSMFIAQQEAGTKGGNAWKKAMEDMASAGEGWRGTLETIDGAHVEAIKHYLQAGVEQGKLATAYGLTASQIHAVVASLKEEAEVRKIVDAATKEAGANTRAWLAETTKAASEYVKAHTTAYQKALEIAEKTNDEIALSGVSGKMREIRALEQKEKAEIDALAFLRKEYPKVYDELVGVVKQKYALMTAEAIGSSQDIIDVAHQLGLKTKEDIAGNLELARNNYIALKNSGVLSIGELRKAWENLHQAEIDADGGVGQFKEALDLLGNGLTQLAQASGDTFGGMVQDIAKAVAALKIASDAAETMRKAVATGDRTGMAMGGLGALTALTSATAPNASRGTGRGQAVGALSGAATGAMIGTLVFPVVGSLLGAMVGAIVGIVRNLGPSAAELGGREVEKQFEDSMGGFQGMLETVTKAYNAVGKSNAQAEADVKRLLAAEKQGGDAVKAVMADIQKQIDLGKQAVAELPVVMQRVAGGMNAISAGTIGGFNRTRKLLNESGGELVGLEEKAATLTAQIGELNAKDHLTPKQEAQLNAWQRQLADVQTEITGLIGQQSRASAAFKEIGQTGQDEFDRVGRLATTAFNAAIAGGQTFQQAIDGITPTLNDLTGAQNAWGFTASGTLATLLQFSKVSETNKELIGTVDGINQMMSGLHTMGLLTQQDFDDLNGIATETFEKLKAEGLDGNTALKAMQPTLQKIWELQQDFGLSVDDGTQAMLDQAKTNGIVGEQMRSVQQQTLDVLKAIAKALGAEIPGAAKEGADKTQKALDGIHAPDLTIHVGYEYDNPEDPQQHATGGFVSGARGFAIGGIAGRATPTRMAIGSGTDTVPAMLTPGELVLNVAQQRNVAAALVGSGQAQGGGTVTNNVYQIQATDVDSFKRLLDKEGIPYIFAELRHNRRGGLTNVADAVS